VDPHESSRSYVFGPSTITVGRIQHLALLGYFAEVTAREQGEEVVSVPTKNKAVVFEEFFADGIRMPPQPILADILLKFQV
jgi:hypothetical protein